MNVEIETETAHFPEKEYIKGIDYTARLGDVSTSCGASERRQKHKNKVGNK